MPSKADKVKKLMGNFVGASASVAVVAAVASFSISVEANFIDVTVFQSKAFYQLEVREIVEIEGSGELPEDAPEPVNTPVRLRVQNQWDDFSIPLIYGYNEGFIEPLRADQQYTLTIELQQAIGWSSLDVMTFDTDPETAAVISTIEETTSPLNPLISFDIEVFTQDGGIPADAWYLDIDYGDISQREPLILGDNSLTLTDLPHVNDDLTLDVIAQFGEESRSITSRVVRPTEFVDASIDLAFPSLTTLQVSTTQDTSFFESSYLVRLTQDELAPVEYTMDDVNLAIENLVQGATYHFEWLMRYTSQGARKDLLLHEQTLIPIVTPLFVLSVLNNESSPTIELTIDNDLILDKVELIIEHNNQTESFDMTLMSESDAAFFYSLSLPQSIPFQATIQLVITQAAPYDYPITLQTLVFQGGNA